MFDSHLVQTGLVLTVFVIVYLGMILGGLPRLQLDRTGVALLGAIAIVGTGVMTPEQAAQSLHLPTLVLLFSFMVISAQMRLAGFYGAVTRCIAALRVGAPALPLLRAQAVELPEARLAARVDDPPYDGWQTIQGLAVAAA